MTKKNRRKNTAPPAATAILPTNIAPASTAPSPAPAEDLDIAWERFQLTSLCTPVPDTLDDRFGALSDVPDDCLVAYRQALAYGQDLGEAIVGQRWLLALGIGLRAGRAMAGIAATSIDGEVIAREAYEKGELEGKRLGFIEGRDFEKEKVRKMSGMFSACVTVDVGVGTDFPSTPIPSPAPEPLPSAPPPLLLRMYPLRRPCYLSIGPLTSRSPRTSTFLTPILRPATFPSFVPTRHRSRFVRFSIVPAAPVVHPVEPRFHPRTALAIRSGPLHHAQILLSRAVLIGTEIQLSKA
ncbi:hypothetical protein R3P38DRAFT_3600715 [Favolaschia claudopus]|uniref:Uncharacterized protein n=1 Tax=Favolaschia claudopus TaxID=2862362 RepID=A0AAW0ACC3_9AGAR